MNNSKALEFAKSSQSSVAKMGEEKDKYLSLRVLEDDQRRLDELRRAEADLPSRGSMVRRLIARAYEALSKAPE